MKRILSVALLLAFLFGLAACNNTEADKADNITKSGRGASKAASTLKTEEAQKVEQADAAAEQTAPERVPVERITLSAYEKELTVGESFMPIVTMLPENATDKTEIWKSDNTDVATVNKYGRITAVASGECTVTVTSADNNTVFASFKATVKPAPKVELTYVDGILIANKSYPLPADYNPGTNPEAKAALDEMFAAAAADGYKLWVRSGFRSYATQKSLYQNYVKRDGAAAADRYSARPGYSEHQTGLAFDINNASSSFNNTPEAKWLAENAYKYGFILRYPEGKESVTGYIYESWHYRYVGIDKAKLLFESGLTIEEYYNLSSHY